MKFTEDYPYNLLERVFEKDSRKPEEWPEDAEGSVAYVLYQLPERERVYMEQFYKENRTMDEIGEAFGVTHERVRQIIVRAERRLRTPRLARFLTLGVQGVISSAFDAQCGERYRELLGRVEQSVMETVKQTETTITPMAKAEILKQPLTALNLSIRPHNRLVAKGCETVGDVMSMSYGDFNGIEHMGAVSRKQVIDALERLGLDCLHLKVQTRASARADAAAKAARVAQVEEAQVEDAGE